MSRRLLGYVVKLPDGTRSPLTPKPVPVIGDAVDAWIGAPDGSCVCPVFAIRKPKPSVVVPPLAQALAILSIDEPKPAPVVAGERYAVLTEDSGDAHFQDINDGSAGYPRDAQRAIGTHAQAVAHHAKWGGEVVRILADGEHEAAVESARREAADDAREHTLVVLRNVLSEPKGLAGMMVFAERQALLDRVREEAAKGQAK